MACWMTADVYCMIFANARPVAGLVTHAVMTPLRCAEVEMASEKGRRCCGRWRIR